jgi:UDP-N-acetylmuramoyl-tripeptide--D-alanyl-D-alanine ligase
MNNRIGMPLTLLAVPVDAEAVVLELGTNEPGEIMTLGLIARPDICVITTVGESHLEKLGSIEGVLNEKLDLLRCMASNGQCVVGDDPAELAVRARRLCSKVRVAGWSEHADPELRPEHHAIDVFGRYQFQWKGQTAVAPLPGPHAVTDALIALAIAELVGVSARDAVRGLTTAETGSMRGEVRRIGGLTVIVDCYNANPQSVRAALELLEGQGAASRRVAVLGTMLELGTSSSRLHDEVLGDVLERNVDLVIATGGFAEAAERAQRADEDRVITAPDWRQAYPRLRERLEGHDIVLLKASRGIAMEGILPMLEKDFGSPGAEGREAV